MKGKPALLACLPACMEGEGGGRVAGRWTNCPLMRCAALPAYSNSSRGRRTTEPPRCNRPATAPGPRRGRANGRGWIRIHPCHETSGAAAVHRDKRPRRSYGLVRTPGNRCEPVKVSRRRKAHMKTAHRSVACTSDPIANGSLLDDSSVLRSERQIPLPFQPNPSTRLVDRGPEGAQPLLAAASRRRPFFRKRSHPFLPAVQFARATHND